MVSNPPFAERSFRHDPRMRQALAGLGREDPEISHRGPNGTSLYWMLRARRPRLTALTGRIARGDLLIVACALADCGSKLVVDPAHDRGTTRAALAAAGLDWLLRSGDCLPCLHRVRAYDCLIVGPSSDELDEWRHRLDRSALIVGLGRDEAAVDETVKGMMTSKLAGDVARVRDGPRQLLVAEGGAF